MSVLLPQFYRELQGFPGPNPSAEPPVILTVTRALVVLRHIRKSPYSPPPKLGKLASPKKVFRYSHVGTKIELSNKNVQKGPKFGAKLSRSQNKDTDLLILCELSVHKIATAPLSKAAPGDNIAQCPRDNSLTVAWRSPFYQWLGQDCSSLSSVPQSPQRGQDAGWWHHAATSPLPISFIYLLLPTCLEYFETGKISVLFTFVFIQALPMGKMGLKIDLSMKSNI